MSSRINQQRLRLDSVFKLGLKLGKLDVEMEVDICGNVFSSLKLS